MQNGKCCYYVKREDFCCKGKNYLSLLFVTMPASFRQRRPLYIVALLLIVFTGLGIVGIMCLDFGLNILEIFCLVGNTPTVLYMFRQCVAPFAVPWRSDSRVKLKRMPIFHTCANRGCPKLSACGHLWCSIKRGANHLCHNIQPKDVQRWLLEGVSPHLPADCSRPRPRSSTAAAVASPPPPDKIICCCCGMGRSADNCVPFLRKARNAHQLRKENANDFPADTSPAIDAAATSILSLGPG